MTDFGLKIYNTSGDTQIDSLYQNYITVETGSFTCPNSRGFNSVSFSSSISDSYTPIIAFTSSVYHYISLYSLNYSGGNFTGFTYGHTPGISETIYYAVYLESDAISPTSDTYGMNIYNSSGELVFTNNGNDYFNILTVDATDYSGTYPDQPSPNYVTVQDADNNYFALYPWLASRFVVGEPPPLVQYSYSMGMNYIDSTTIRVGSYYWSAAVEAGTPPGFTGVGTLIELKRT